MIKLSMIRQSPLLKNAIKPFSSAEKIITLELVNKILIF